MQPGERILIFSGLNTFGTQAAVEFVCRPETAAELLRQVTGPNGEIRPFEALIETTIPGGVSSAGQASDGAFALVRITGSAAVSADRPSEFFLPAPSHALLRLHGLASGRPGRARYA